MKQHRFKWSNFYWKRKNYDVTLYKIEFLATDSSTYECYVTNKTFDNQIFDTVLLLFLIEQFIFGFWTHIKIDIDILKLFIENYILRLFINEIKKFEILELKK